MVNRLSEQTNNSPDYVRRAVNRLNQLSDAVGSADKIKRAAAPAYLVKSGTYNLDAVNDKVIYADTSTGIVVINLSSAVGADGLSYSFKNVGTSLSNLLRLVPVSGQTIDGSPTRTLIINDGVEIQAVNGNWQIVDSYYPATHRLIYSQTTVKAGDTINADAVPANTIQNFASNVILPAGSMVPGQTFDFAFMGVFTTSLGGPSTTAYIRMNTTPVVSTVPLNLVLGVADYAYWGNVQITVVTSGVSGSVRAGGILTFQNGAMDSVVYPAKQLTTTIDTTINQTLQLSMSNNTRTAGNSNRLESLRIYESRPPKASS